MARIVLFHSVLGIRRGIREARQVLESAGHRVDVPDLYGDGLSFEDYPSAMAHADGIGGDAELLRRGVAAVAGLPADVVYAGFSAGGACAEYLAATRPGARGAVLFAESIPLPMLCDALGQPRRAWPREVPVQVHYTFGDPFRDQRMIDQLAAQVAEAGARWELHEYPGSGHLFTDADRPDEYDAQAAATLWKRVLAFLPADQ